MKVNLGDYLKFFFLVFMLMTIISTSLYAKNIYIKVTTVWHSDFLVSIQYDLDELGYVMHLDKHEGLYGVYVGPFQNQDGANLALVKIKKYVDKNAHITNLNIVNHRVIHNNVNLTQAEKRVSPKKVKKKEIQEKHQSQVLSEINSNALIVKNKEKNNEPPKILENIQMVQENDSKSNNSFFVGVTAGSSKLAVTQNNISGSLPLDIELKDYGLNYGLEAGYYFNENIFMTLSYQQTDTENIYFNHMFSTLNYKFDEMYSISPYIGFLAGNSMMTWKNYPLKSTLVTDSSFSLIAGAQVGSELPIYRNISTYIFYRYLLINHKTGIKTTAAETELEHREEQTLNMGLKYNF